MRRVFALALLLLAVPGTALAAPPANDNRADAEAIAAFPHTLAATTAEATVERLDPQVSRCGRVESTIWYRIDTAPDGLIRVGVTGASGVAPVVRIYRRTPSAIVEADCGSAGAGGTAAASLETVRGSNYLILVGRRPGTADGSLELRAELFLPPPNDDRPGAAAVRLPGSLRGSTLGATAGDEDPERCGLDGGTVWYRLASPGDRRVLLRVTAAGQLDLAIVVLERVRSRTETMTCRVTDRRGRATLAFGSRRGASYLVAVGQVGDGDPGMFRIETFLSEAAESLRAGKQLPRRGVRSTVHGLTDVNDVWRVSMQQGTTYRIGFSAASCSYVTLRARRQLSRVLAELECRGYRTFTPGPEGGGEYVLEVESSGRAQPEGYRLLVAPAAPDDIGVGLPLRNRVPLRGALDPSRLDLQDVYHFDVERRGDVRIAVTGGLAVQLLTDDGRRLGSFTAVRRQLSPGRYVVAVTADAGGPRHAYTLSLLIREITTVALRPASATVEPGSSVSLEPAVANASSGVVEIQIDRFDPLTGWHFNRLLRVAVGSGVQWRPPAEGRWRLRATFKGTLEASPSRSGYVHLVVKAS